LLLGRAFLKFNVDGLLRGDIAGRYAAYSTGMQSGFLNINDIHRLEDLRPVEGGDVYRVPLANIDLSAANLMELDKRTVIAQRLILAGFDPAAVLVSLGMAPIAHTGLPSTMLQPVAQVSPDAPKDAYSVGSRDVTVAMGENVINIPAPIVNIPQTVVNVPETVVRVTTPEQKMTVRTVERDADGRVSRIIESNQDGE